MSTPTRKWQAGDWAFTKRYGSRVQVDAVTSRGLVLRFKTGIQGMYEPDDIRPETFGEYLTRPTGFGRTKWRSWIAQQVGLACILAAGIATVDFGGWWGIGSWLVVQSVYLYMTWRNFKKLTV